MLALSEVPTQENSSQKKDKSPLPHAVKGSLTVRSRFRSGSLSPIGQPSVLLCGCIKRVRGESSPIRPMSSCLTRDRFVWFQKSCVLQLCTPNCLLDIFSSSSNSIHDHPPPKLAPPLASPPANSTRHLGAKPTAVVSLFFSLSLTPLAKPWRHYLAMSPLSLLSTSKTLSPFTPLSPHP